ncbi:MAG TPA: V-type ATP synthase subunit D [Bacilli bacterium]|nr:V-type ATP synthase subunit D [Bacilli bacterium]HPS18764.1 V-type ATP synthase subunit D [Bacilli bacterium]
MNSKAIPTKSNLMAIKKSLSLATTGQSLMERKKNILVREMLLLMPKVNEIRDQIYSVYSKAYLALQETNITLGIVNEITKAIPIDNGVHLSFRNVMGVDIPVVTHTPKKISLSYGLKSTNSKFDYAYQMFLKARDLTVKLAEIDNAVYSLANGIRKAQKRANALENIVIPNLIENIKYISEVLEEREREEFVRMKVIKARQK